MKARKKLLIALLSATCLTAGAFGLAACKNDKSNEETPEEPDGAYTVVAKDNDGNPVGDVWFCIGYVDGYTFVNVKAENGSDNLTAKSGADGKAKFNFEPEEDKTYQIRLADNIEGTNLPYGYMALQSYVNFTDSTSVDFSLQYLPNHFNYNKRTALDYKRVYDTATNGAKIVESENKFTLESGRHTYFYFNPYQEPASGSNVTSIQAATASAGVYEVSFTCSSSATVNMYEITSTYISTTNTEGIPDHNDPANPVTLELTVANGASIKPNYFGIYADADCEVSINITRTGDAVEPDAILTRKAEFTAPTAKCGEGTGTLSLMPADGTINTVKGADGFYHVGTADGPVLYATLTKAISRVSDTSIKDMPTLSIDGADNGNVFILPEVNANNQVIAYVDYTEVVAEYSKWVNNDGVYPVNDDLYSFLNAYGGNCYSAKPNMPNWLLPCQFYVPEGGIDVSGSGMQYDPYILAETENRIDLTSFTDEKAYLKFTANSSGAYSFVVTDGTVSSRNGALLNGKLFVAALIGDEIELELIPGSDGVISLTVAVESDSERGIKFIEAEAGGMDVTDPNKQIDGKGISEDTAISILFGVSAYIVDSYTNRDGVWVKFNAFGNDTYTIKVIGENAKFEYNGQTYTAGQTLTLECTSGSDYTFLLSTTKQLLTTESDYDLNLLYIALAD